jgi:hypothetical protein
MQGVTTAIVAFLFVCLMFPAFVKNKPQYYAAFTCVVVVILLSGLETVIETRAFAAFATFAIALLQVSAMVLLTLSVGGLTFKQFTGEVSHAFEVIRRGETTKEIIIPLHGQQFENRPAQTPPAPPPPPTPPAPMA